MSLANASELKEIDQVKKSYQRCLLHPDFFDKFYEYFFKTDKRIPELFKNTDFTLQRTAIKHGIEYMIMYAEGSRIADAKIDSLSTKHDRNHLNITPDLYNNWMEALIKTIQSYDSEFNSDLQNSWTRILSYSISRIKSKY